MAKKSILFSFVIFLSTYCGALNTLTKSAKLYFSDEAKSALKTYEMEIEKNPSTDTYLNASFIAVELGQISKAFKILNKAIEKYPENSDLKRELAIIYTAKQKYKNARKIYFELIDNNTVNSLDYLNIARIELNTGNYTQAENYLNRSLLLDKTIYLSYFFLGRVYEALNKPYYAIKAYEKLLDYDNQILLAKKHLAKLYLDMNNPQTSYKYYKSVSYALPKNDAIKKQTEKVKDKLKTPQKEIILPEGIINYRKIKKFKIHPKIPVIKVALSTSTNGLPVKTDEFYFSVSCGFWVKTPENKKILSGGSGRVWSVKYDENKKKSTLFDHLKKPVVQFSKSVKIVPPKTQSCTIILHSALFDNATAWAGRADRQYRGDMEFSTDNKRKSLIAVNHVNLEEYLYSVLPSEMPDFYPFEALKAQAILARTYFLKNKKNNYYFDLCDSQKCQVYKGVENETPQTTKAVNETQGMILTYRDKSVYAVFSSNCGGISQSSKNAWGFEYDYLKPRVDYVHNDIIYSPYSFKKMFKSAPAGYCSPSKYVNSKNYRWTRYVYSQDISKKISAKKDIGKITAVLPLKRSISGHLQKVLVKGTKDSYLLDNEAKIKYYLSFGRLKSTAFIIEPYYKGKYIDHLLIYGAGWGHAVGMCQSGASGRADAGHNYRQILGHYFRGTKLKNLVYNLKYILDS